MACSSYVVPPAFQLQSGGRTGPFDCTPWATSRAIGHATCGSKLPSGRNIRLLSNEAIPNPASPGLNLTQVADVAWNDYGVWLDVRIGSRKVTWAEYERRRKAGQGCIIQTGYSPIADSKYDAGNGFRGNHALFESIHATYDPLADGRYANVWKHDGSVYTREIIKRAAGMLDIGGARAGYGNVWAAFTKDVVGSYRVRIPAGDFWAYHVPDGLIAYKRERSTGGFSADCTPPRSYRWKSDPSQTTTLVRLTSGGRTGMYVSSKWSKEV